MNNIVISNEDNSGSLAKIHFAPVTDVYSIPAAVDFVIASPVVMNEGKNWFSLECTQDTPGYDDKPLKEVGVTARAINVSGFIPGHNAGLTSILNEMEQGRFIVIGEDQEGNKRLLGTKSNPLRFKYEFDTGEKFSNRKGYKFSFYHTANATPFFFESPFITYPPEFSSDADFITLDAYLASYLSAITIRVEELEAVSHEQNSDTILAEGTDDEVSAEEIREYIDSDPLQQAKDYADSLVVGLLDDRGNYDPSINTNLYPDANGSGPSGAIRKGDIYTIAGLGAGITTTIGTKIVKDGDTVRSIADDPGQTEAYWVITENNLEYVPENVANKSTNVNTDQASDTKYASVKAVFDWATGLFQTLANKDASGGYAGLTLFKINFKNVANTFTSFFTNSNTAARTYTFQDRDGTIADDTDLALKANITYVDDEVQAAKDHADALVVGLWDDRGNHDASGNTFPSSGGSGPAGAILKGDIWSISVAGTLGGHPVTAGDTVRALVDSPGTTDANWAIAENNIGYVPENSVNKSTDVDADKASDIKYATVKALYDFITALVEKDGFDLRLKAELGYIFEGDSPGGNVNFNNLNALFQSGYGVDLSNGSYVKGFGELLKIYGVSDINLNSPNISPSSIPYLNADKNIVSSSVTPTQLGYLSGVTSPIQTQLAGKVNKAGDIMTDLLQFSGTGHAGIKLNNLTTAQRNALTPSQGMVIENADTGRINHYSGTAWEEFGGFYSYTPTLDPVWSTTNTAGEAVTGLTHSGKANKTYDFIIFLKVKTYNTSGYKVAISGPAGSTLAGTLLGSGANGALTLPGTLLTPGTLCTATFASTAAAGEAYFVTMHGSIKTSTTPGDISVIFAPVSTQGGVMQLGSWANFTEK